MRAHTHNSLEPSMGVRNIRLLIIGPPGAGKGTVSSFLQKKYGIFTLSTGEALRKEQALGTDLGKMAAELMAKGELVPDSVVSRIVRNALLEMPNGFMLDGFPRSVAQAEILSEMLRESGQGLDGVLYLYIADKLIADRLMNRLVCQNCGASYHKQNMKPKVEWVCDECSTPLTTRDDDKPDNIARRLKVFYETTKPLIQYYARRDLLNSINAEQPVHIVRQTVERVILDLTP